MTSSELTLWIIVMLPSLLLYCFILGIVSLNYYRLLYNIEFSKFYTFFLELRFPLSLYKEPGVYTYAEKINRSTNFAYIRALRFILGIVCGTMNLVGLVGFNSSMPLQQFILLVLFLIQSVILILSLRFGHNLNILIAESNID